MFLTCRKIFRGWTASLRKSCDPESIRREEFRLLELGTDAVQPLKLQKTLWVAHNLTNMNLKITDVVAFRASDLILGKMGIHLGKNEFISIKKKVVASVSYLISVEVSVISFAIRIMEPQRLLPR
jgi:hypothetical protein